MSFSLFYFLSEVIKRQEGARRRLIPFEPFVQFGLVTFWYRYGGIISRDIVPKILDQQYLFRCAQF